MGLSDVLALLSGVAFFLFGMSTMGNGLKKVAGNKMQTYLWKLSSTPVKGFLLGTLVAAVIQSSSATSVMVVSFVNAGMMKFAQAICIILGANVGTTMTGWILTLSSSSGSGIIGTLLSTATLIALIAIAGIIMNMFAKKDISKNIGLICLGLGTLLLSMTLISEAVAPLKTSAKFQSILVMFENPVLGVLAGIVVAAILQSCSASVGIIQALCVTGSISYNLCLPLILGINIGASAPVLMSMIGANKNSKRTAFSYFISNILGLIIIYVLYIPANLLGLLGFLPKPASVLGIAIMNTMIRIIVSIVLLPAHKILEKAVLLVFPIKEEETADVKELDGLTDSLLNYPSAALAYADNCCKKMAMLSHENVQRAIELLDNYDNEKFNLVISKENTVDKYEDNLGNFIVKVSKNALSAKEQRTVSELLNVINDLERISDHALNIAETAREIFEKKIIFSEGGKLGIKKIVTATTDILDMTINAFTSGSPELADGVEPLEEIIDELVKILRAEHTDRLQKSNCTIEMGFVFNDMLTNCERISDHCSNIAFCVCQKTAELSEEAHVYAGNVVMSDNFKEKYAAFRKIYIEN